jgi:hypothetical protein
MLAAAKAGTLSHSVPKGPVEKAKAKAEKAAYSPQLAQVQTHPPCGRPRVRELGAGRGVRDRERSSERDQHRCGSQSKPAR